MSKRSNPASSSAAEREEPVQDDLSWDYGMEVAKAEYTRMTTRGGAVNKYEPERKISALQGLVICDERNQARHEEVLTALVGLQQGTHLSAKELQEAAMKKRRLSKTEETAPSLDGRFVQGRPLPGKRNPEQELPAIRVKQSIHIKDGQGTLHEWLEGHVAKRLSDGVWIVEEGASARLKRSAVKIFPATDRADTEDAVPELTPPGQDKEGSLARVLPSARPPLASSKWESWVLAKLPVGRVKKYHASVLSPQGKKRAIPAYFTVDFRLRGRALSGREELVTEDEIQLVTIKVEAAGLEFLAPDDPTLVSTVTEEATGLQLQRPAPGQKVCCEIKIKDRAIFRLKRFNAKVSDLTSEKDCAYFHDAKKGKDCIRVFLEEGPGAKLAVFSRAQGEFVFRSALPDHLALANNPEDLVGVPEALKVLGPADVPSPPAERFTLDTLVLAELKMPGLPQDPQLGKGWSKLSIRVLEQSKPQTKKTTKSAVTLMIEIPFAGLPPLRREVSDKDCHQLTGEAQLNEDSLRRLLEVERLPIGSKLIMRLKFPTGEAVDKVSCRVLSCDESDKKKPLMTLAIPGEHREYRLSLPYSGASFDNGEAAPGPVVPLKSEEDLPANTDRQLASLTKYILTHKARKGEQGSVVHKENKLLLCIPAGQTAKGAKEQKKWLSELQAEHAELIEDVTTDKLSLVFHYPQSKNIKKFNVNRDWLGTYLILDTSAAPILNKPPRPQENGVVDILEGEFAGSRGLVLQELNDDSDSFNVRIRVSPSEYKEAALPASSLWCVAPDDKEAEASARQGERLERAQVIGGASQVARQVSLRQEEESSSDEEDLEAVRLANRGGGAAAASQGDKDEEDEEIEAEEVAEDKTGGEEEDEEEMEEAE